MYCVVIENTQNGHSAVHSKYQTKKAAYEAGVKIEKYLSDKMQSGVEVLVIENGGKKCST
jgi:hypothetical protein